MVSLLKLLALGAAVCADDAADGFKNTTGADELRTFVGGATIFAIEWTDGVPTGWAFARQLRSPSRTRRTTTRSGAGGRF